MVEDKWEEVEKGGVWSPQLMGERVESAPIPELSTGELQQHSLEQGE